MLAAYLEDATTEETRKQIAALSGVDSIPSPSVTARRILTVEDDAAIRRGIVDVLTFAGFDVLEAGNGKEGWKRALRHSYDLLLLDLVLPGPSGLEILTDVRRVRPTQPVILLTAITGLVIIMLTEVSSNTATAAVFMPLLGALAVSVNVDVLLLTVPAAIAASCAFMMPVATPPNAIVFATGRLKIQSMVRAGLALNVACVILATLIPYAVISFIW